MLADKLNQDFVDGVTALEATRLAIAAKNRDLALRTLDARILRLKLQTEFRKSQTKSDAEDSAKEHPDYIAFEQATAQITYERDVLWAKAEVIRLELQGYIQTQEVAA